MRAAADPGGVSEAADLLLRARSPLIWAGHGVLYAEASAELQEVAELLGAPVMTTLQGKSAIPETHELSVGTSAVVETAGVAHYMDESDTYLIVGSSLSVGPFSPVLGPGKTLIHVTNDPSDINKWHATRLPLVADAKLFLAQLAEELRRARRRPPAPAPRPQQRDHRHTGPRVAGGVRRRIQRRFRAHQRLPSVSRAVGSARSRFHDPDP